MKYRLTVLNIWTFFSILLIGVQSIFNYEELSKDEGWGIIGFAGILGLCLVALIFDIILQIFIKNKLVLNLCGLVLSIIVTFLILIDL